VKKKKSEEDGTSFMYKLREECLDCFLQSMTEERVTARLFTEYFLSEVYM
jgi:hypothetical protein